MKDMNRERIFIIAERDNWFLISWRWNFIPGVPAQLVKNCPVRGERPPDTPSQKIHWEV